MSGKPGVDKLKGDAKQSLDRVAKVLGQGTFPKQLVTGTASGWFTGAIVGYAGKGVALALGSGIILYQIAHHKGYVTKDWIDLKELAQKKSIDMSKNTPAINKMRTFATKNKAFTAGFVGGFLLGIAF